MNTETQHMDIMGTATKNMDNSSTTIEVLSAAMQLGAEDQEFSRVSEHWQTILSRLVTRVGQFRYRKGHVVSIKRAYYLIPRAVEFNKSNIVTASRAAEGLPPAT